MDPDDAVPQPHGRCPNIQDPLKTPAPVCGRTGLAPSLLTLLAKPAWGNDGVSSMTAQEDNLTPLVVSLLCVNETLFLLGV